MSSWRLLPGRPRVPTPSALATTTRVPAGSTAMPAGYQPVGTSPSSEAGSVGFAMR